MNTYRFGVLWEARGRVSRLGGRWSPSKILRNTHEQQYSLITRCRLNFTFEGVRPGPPGVHSSFVLSREGGPFWPLRRPAPVRKHFGSPRPPRPHNCARRSTRGGHLEHQKSSAFGVWEAPAAPTTILTSGNFLKRFSGPPGPPRPQVSTIFDRPKNHVFRTLV